ncbi:hypothetical protein BASA50_008481 [Batrachochytrium salamandrivorans]|uniref:RxLR effector protein n=1 Tax=Batrachochytrium salamandrivorans TaxID=1357716 RepID=A0ABQ8F531_9FUNG|nr:hypothetical protein BASA50_008481 [Batrachochytrium salamandrivorans]
MKLAIASTTILFAMMAAQAAVLSATSTADVNLVKRAPTSDDDDEQSDMAGQSSSVPTSQDPLTEHEEDQMKHLYAPFVESWLLSPNSRNVIGKTSPACTNANTEITKLEKKLVSLEVQLEAILEEYETKLHERNDVEKARRLEDHAYLRSYLEDHLVEVG